jgi:hypothetical protein
MKNVEEENSECGAEGYACNDVAEIVHAQNNSRDCNAESEKKQGD